MNNGLCDRFCPPLMNDGRHVTDYSPSCYVHDLILKQNNLKTSSELKSFLTTNALDLQKINRNFYNSKNRCGKCNHYLTPDPNEHIAYWDNYSRNLGYDNVMHFCEK